jgi:1,2-diacylglycerol 3-beta-galactosyltransferase
MMKLPIITECNNLTLIHERYNAQWIQAKEVGLVVRNFRQIEKAVDQFLVPETFARYRANVSALNNRAVFEVANFLERILATRNKIQVKEPIKHNQLNSISK